MAPALLKNLRWVQFYLGFSEIMECGEKSKVGSRSSDPLLSCMVTFYTVGLIYLPCQFWKVMFSPALILTAMVLFSMLRMGATQKSQVEEQENLDDTQKFQTGKKENLRELEEGDEEEHIEKVESDRSGRKLPGLLEEARLWMITRESETGFSPCFVDSFVEWNVKAPLEVIYEEYEGEEDAADYESSAKEETAGSGLERYPSLSLYFPETDSDDSSDSGYPAAGKWESQENVCFIWEDEEEDGEGLIEITLTGSANDKKMNGEELQAEEENLIEIDISPRRYDEITGENSRFSI